MDCKIYRYIFCGCFVTGHVCVNSNDTSPYVVISMKKNVPWHILAPSAVACDMFLLRASAHHWHVSAFLCNREFQGISYYTKKPSYISVQRSSLHIFKNRIHIFFYGIQPIFQYPLKFLDRCCLLCLIRCLCS